jgi:hypothetical protein
VRYEAMNAMLLTQFLKEHREVEKLEATVAQLDKVRGGHRSTESASPKSERTA